MGQIPHLFQLVGDMPAEIMNVTSRDYAQPTQWYTDIEVKFMAVVEHCLSCNFNSKSEWPGVKS